MDFPFVFFCFVFVIVFFFFERQRSFKFPWQSIHLRPLTHDAVFEIVLQGTEKNILIMGLFE